MVSLSDVLFWKYGPVFGTKQVDPNERSANPKMRIWYWKHLTLPEPDDIQIAKDTIAYEAYLDSVRYKDMRRSEYPSIEDQLDAIWKGGQAFDDMKASINAVKAKYPKPA